MKKWIFPSVLMVLAATVLAAGGYWVWLRTPPAMPQNMDQALALVQSPRFTRLSESRKDAYYEKIRELGEAMSPEDRRAMWDKVRDNDQLRDAAREVHTEAMMDRAKDFALADAATKTRILDQFIGMTEAMRQNMPRPPQTGNGPRETRSDADRAADRQRRKEWMQNQITKGNPQKQAYMMEFMKAMSERRKQLGLDPMPGPPGRPPGR